MAKPDYDTIRGLERKSSKLFKVAGLLGIIGLISAVFVPFIGIPMLVIGAIIFFYGMVWMLKLQKEPVRHLFCPYCASKNDVFFSRTEFACDICNRRVGVSPRGEPIPLETVVEDDD